MSFLSGVWCLRALSFFLYSDISRSSASKSYRAPFILYAHTLEMMLYKFANCAQS